MTLEIQDNREGGTYASDFQLEMERLELEAQETCLYYRCPCKPITSISSFYLRALKEKLIVELK